MLRFFYCKGGLETLPYGGNAINTVDACGINRATAMVAPTRKADKAGVILLSP